MAQALGDDGVNDALGEFGLELRTRDRERKLLKKIDSALERIEDGSYGYCEETGEEIGLRRLEARPVATLSVEENLTLAFRRALGRKAVAGALEQAYAAFPRLGERQSQSAGTLSDWPRLISR